MKTYPIFKICLSGFLSLFLYSNTSFGQTDSLKKELAKYTTSEEKLSQLAEWVDTLAKNNLTAAISTAKIGLELATTEENTERLAYFNQRLGRFYNRNAVYDTSLLFFDAALKTYQTLNNTEQQYAILESKGAVYINLGNFTKATEVYVKALRFYEATNDKIGIAYAYLKLADIFSYQEDFEKGVEYGNKAIQIATEIEAKAELLDAYSNTSYNYLGLKMPEKAFEMIEKAVNLKRQLGEKDIQLAILLNSKGNALKHLERYEEAVNIYEKGYEIVEELGHVSGMSAIIANISDVYLRMENYQAALPVKLKAVKLMEDNNIHSNLMENYQDLMEIYVGLGDYKNALIHSENYNSLRDSFFSVEKETIISDLDAKYQTEQKVKLITEQEATIAQSQKIQYLSFGIAALLATFLAGLFYFFRKNQEKNAVLNEQNTIIETKNQQNELLLKEIHHRVKNNLETVSSLLALQSATIEDPTVLDAMMESQNRVQSMGMIHQKLYQGENLAAIEMKDYFINLSEGILDSFGAEGRIQVECVMQELELDVDTAVPIGLITNELLTNSLKYAFPDGRNGKIKISIKAIDSDNLELTVADDGIGKNTLSAQESKGFGTQLIKLLTLQIDGKLVEVINQGTIISLQFKKSVIA